MDFFNSIRGKLLTFFMGSVIMYGILFFASHYLFNQVKTSADSYQAISTIGRALESSKIQPLQALYQSTLEAGLSHSTATSAQIINVIAQQSKMLSTGAEDAAFPDKIITDDLTALAASQNEFLQILNNKIIPSIKNNQAIEASDLEAIKKTYQNHQAIWSKIKLTLEKQALEEANKIKEIDEYSKRHLTTFSIGVIIAGLMIALMISRNIAKPIDIIIKHVGEISHGNYSIQLIDTGAQELLNLSNKINSMANKLLDQTNFRNETQKEILKYQGDLLQALEEQRAIFDSAGLGIALMQNRKILRLNPTFAELFKSSEEALINQSIERYYVNPKDFEKIGKDGYGIIRRGQTYTDVVAFKDAEGKDFMCRVSGKALNAGDIDRGTVWIFEDITERRKLLDALKEHATFLDTLIDAIPIPIFYKDANAKFLVVNKAYEETFNVKRESLIGKTVNEANIYSLEDGVKYYEEDMNVIQNQLNTPKKRDIVFADGNAHHTIYWLKGFKKADGTIGGQVGTIIDNTEQQKAQLATERAKQLAEESAHMKTDFLANMSHEIRTPMNAIIGMSHLMLKTELDPKQTDYLNKMQQSGQHLLGLINDILDFSKLEAGEVKIENNQINLDRLIENVSDLVQFKAQEKGLELNFDLGKDVPREVMGDTLRISQILINYVNNAVKFTEAGGITIITRLEGETEHAVDLYFGVKDTGIGIDERAKKKLFASFQQADTSTTRKYGGTGLGLAISKSLATLMGGTVGLDSIPGLGSTFWFRVRLNKAIISDTKQNLSTKISGQRVLIVDDNAYSRQVLADFLSDIELRVDIATSGEEAVIMTRDAANAETPYKIIFLDWHMPEMDGFETASQIRSLGLPHEAKIVLVTAFGREDVLNNSAAYGIENIIIKPVTVAVLHDTVAHILGVEMKPTYINNNQESTALISQIAGSQVLVVEDNDLNQEVAVGLLKHAKIHADVAIHGLDAIAKIHSKKYDLVLMDMQMPMMGGVEATIKIREDEQYAQLPIIAMTANVLKDDREKCLSAGMNDFIPKPIEPEELWAMLLKWIPKKHANTEHGNIVDLTPAIAPTNTLNSKLNSRLPESIEGLDMRSGIKRVLGNETLYLSMLTKFLEGQKSVISDIKQHLESNDWETAERIAHTVKGLSANIGAQHIADKASVLEMAIRQKNTEDIYSYLDNLCLPLEKLLKSLAETLVPEQETEDDALLDETSKLELLNKLSKLLKNDDPEAVDFFNSHKQQFKKALASLYTEVKNQIEQFSFDIAYQNLSSLFEAKNTD